MSPLSVGQYYLIGDKAFVLAIGAASDRARLKTDLLWLLQLR